MFNRWGWHVTARQKYLDLMKKQVRRGADRKQYNVIFSGRESQRMQYK